MSSKQADLKKLNFEEAYARLEQILEKMNSGTANLDDSLHLYEEADALIAICSKKLSEAEHRVETLIKNREGQLSLGSNQQPETEPFEAR